MRYINQIIVHCTDTPWHMDVDAAWVTAIHKQRGWRTIGYHYLIKLDGTIEKGRPASQPGAHCYKHNAHSIGVCYVGGQNEHGKHADTRTPAQKASLLKLLTNLVKIYRAPILGHRDLAPRDCPCFDAKTEYAGLYKQIVLQ